MKFETKYKFCLWKSYLDKGMALTNYVKYLIAFFALASQEISFTILLAAIYLLLSFFLGWLWFKTDFIKAEIEVGNKYNLFVKEVRNKFVKRKI